MAIFFSKTAKKFFKNTDTLSFAKLFSGPCVGPKLLPEEDGVSAEEYTAKQGVALYQQGKEKGDADVLRQAVETLQQHLAALSQQQTPLEWAKAQNDLGNALRTLGEMELSPKYLGAAIKAYHAALQVFTRDRFPSHWARVLNNLGNTLQQLAGLDSGTHYLQQAITAYQMTLEEMPRWRSPLGWAKIQNSLGSALAVLGKREKNVARLKEAAEAYQNALEVFEDTHTEDVTHYIGAAIHNLELIEGYLIKFHPKN